MYRQNLPVSIASQKNKWRKRGGTMGAFKRIGRSQFGIAAKASAAWVTPCPGLFSVANPGSVGIDAPRREFLPRDGLYSVMPKAGVAAHPDTRQHYCVSRQKHRLAGPATRLAQFAGLRNQPSDDRPTFHIPYLWRQHCVLLPGYASTRGSIADPATPQRAPK